MSFLDVNVVQKLRGCCCNQPGRIKEKIGQSNYFFSFNLSNQEIVWIIHKINEFCTKYNSIRANLVNKDFIGRFITTIFNCSKQKVYQDHAYLFFRLQRMMHQSFAYFQLKKHKPRSWTIRLNRQIWHLATSSFLQKLKLQ